LQRTASSLTHSQVSPRLLEAPFSPFLKICSTTMRYLAQPSTISRPITTIWIAEFKHSLRLPYMGWSNRDLSCRTSSDWVSSVQFDTSGIDLKIRPVSITFPNFPNLAREHWCLPKWECLNQHFASLMFALISLSFIVLCFYCDDFVNLCLPICPLLSSICCCYLFILPFYSIACVKPH